MKRRTFVGTVGTSAVTVAGGCLSGATSDTETTSAPATRRETTGLTAVVGEVSYAGTAGGDESVTGSFDCEAGTAVLDGRLSTSSCRTVTIRALSVDTESNSARLVVYPKWNESGSPENTDCAGATYEYRVRLEASDHLPDEVTVVHERAEGGEPKEFSLVTEC